ncbi:hypothetical protein E2C01_074798 [Portunus trituberculatus]|uniref:Uncharacterized protein n=1 Tax=Portunus trituberculatus TaxID=210409 RepID=A0A5B7IDC8_PORTR|nr:hypothetical protein [Portunus trituberculatus]
MFGLRGEEGIGKRGGEQRRGKASSLRPCTIIN